MAPPFQSRRAHTVVEAVNWTRAAGPQRKTVIVLHCMEAEWSAETCAAYFAGKLKGGAPKASAHFAVDHDSFVQMVPADRIAWHAAGCNTPSIGIEIPGFAKWERARWLSKQSAQALRNAAELVAELSEHFQIPCEFIDAEDLKAKLTGITTHEQVSIAFGKSTHWDPGKGFPVRDFLDWTRSYTSSAWTEIV